MITPAPAPAGNVPKPLPAAEFMARLSGPSAGERLAFILSEPPAGIPPRGVACLWCGGFRSDMRGGKAGFLADLLPRLGCAFLRFDYSGHGESEGNFVDHALSDWLSDAQSMLDFLAARTDGSRIIVTGSSMGAWIASLLAIRNPGRIAGLVLLAPALDFTRRLLVPALPAEALRAIAQQGMWLRPSAYGDGGYPVTRHLIEDGDKHLLLGSPIHYGGPVRILQGQADPDVPFAHALAVAEALSTADIETVLIKDGDHRLSRPQDLARLGAMMREMMDMIAGPPSPP